MSEGRRGMGARLGLVALNLLWPGLGLLRLGHGTLGLLLGGVPFAALILSFIAVTAAPSLGLSVALGPVLVAVFAAIIVSAILTWRRSGSPAAGRQWWSRWYSLAALWVAALAGLLLVPGPWGYLKLFYIPSEAMSPTLARNARILVRMGRPAELRRGDIVIVRAPALDAYYVTRVAALPGDRITIFAGTVVINGDVVPQRFLRSEPVEFAGPGEARRLAERFPGEEDAHEIYDTGPSMADDFAQVEVRPGHIFVLGDNRDHAADSRFHREQMGLEQVPLSNVSGRLIVRITPGD